MTARLIIGSSGHLDALMGVMADSFDPRFGEGWSRPQLAGALAIEPNFLRLAVGEEGHLGFSLCRSAGPEVEVLLVAVRPTVQGRGIGGQLLDAAIKDAALRGAEEIFLEVRDNNVAARRLYGSRGFVEVGRRFEYYAGSNGIRFDAVTMRRGLAVDRAVVPAAG